MEILSIYAVTDFKTRKVYEEAPIGVGEEAINSLRKEYPRFTKFVLEGFEIDGKFVPLYLKYRNND